MKWIHNYQLFLFDFDGLLVNTEALHLEAYRKMCAERGYQLDLDIVTYNRVAQFDSKGPSKAIYSSFPALKEVEWEVLRGRKNQIYQELLARGDISLMPGVVELLTALAEANIKRCVVTHSRLEQINPIKALHPILNTIPEWITRSDYTIPKPHPECYQKAVLKLGAKNDRVIGFEDSPKGLQALASAGVEAVMISPYFETAEMELLVNKPFFHFHSFKDLELIITNLHEKKASSSCSKACVSSILTHK